MKTGNADHKWREEAALRQSLMFVESRHCKFAKGITSTYMPRKSIPPATYNVLLHPRQTWKERKVLQLRRKKERSDLSSINCCNICLSFISHSKKFVYQWFSPFYSKCLLLILRWNSGWNRSTFSIITNASSDVFKRLFDSYKFFDKRKRQ